MDAELEMSANRLMMRNAVNIAVRKRARRMAKMCKSYLTHNEMRGMEKAKSLSNDLVKSVGVRVAQKVSSSDVATRRKRGS